MSRKILIESHTVWWPAVRLCSYDSKEHAHEHLIWAMDMSGMGPCHATFRGCVNFAAAVRHLLPYVLPESTT